MTLTLQVKVGVIHIHAVIKFQNPKCIILWDMNYCPVIFGQVTDGQTDRLQTEYDAYEPTVRGAQVGLIKQLYQSVHPPGGLKLNIN